MTRRGSLIYYLAAWICGCTFMSICISLKYSFVPGSLQTYSKSDAVAFLFFNFYALIFGALSAFLGAFLLRRLTRSMHWQLAWQWASAGAVLAPVLLGGLGIAGRYTRDDGRIAMEILSLLTMGPSMVLDSGIWLAIPAGAATAFVLYRIHRAFVLLASPA